MRSFFMVRHGETTANLNKIATGQMDVELTANGRHQAEQCRIVLNLIKLVPDKIICSGLIRTKQTADIIFQDLSIPIESNSELNEQNYGEWEGKLWEIILPEIEKHGENPPNGESQAEFYTRVISAIENLLSVNNGRILFVTHSGLFKAMFSRYGHEQVKIENGVLYEFIFSDNGDVLLDFIKHKP